MRTSCTWSQLLARVRADAGQASLIVAPEWLHGRTVFGGLQAAVALEAMRTLVPDVPLRTLQGTFLAPVPEGTINATACVLRTGKSTTHVEARIIDGDSTLALLMGVFGKARQSTVNLAPRQSLVQPVGSVDFYGTIRDVMPAFTRHFRVRFLRGGMPYSGVRQADSVLEVSLRDSGPVTEGHVLAMADLGPPVALSWLSAPAPGSTLTWMIEMLTDRFDGLSLEHWRVDAVMSAARHGYTSQSLMLWGPCGEPLATSHQSLAVFG